MVNPRVPGTTEWLHTRRGIIGLSRIATPTPGGAELVSWVWFTESGDSGAVHSDDRLLATADAYRAMVRASR
jgi:hypothetical protein